MLIIQRQGGRKGPNIAVRVQYMRLYFLGTYRIAQALRPIPFSSPPMKVCLHLTCSVLPLVHHYWRLLSVLYWVSPCGNSDIRFPLIVMRAAHCNLSFRKK